MSLKNTKDDLFYWIALRHIEGVGNVCYKRLIDAFHSPEAVFSASGDNLNQIEGISKHVADRIKSFDRFDKVEDELKTIKKGNVSVITLSDNNYPKLLRQVNDPPPLLYAKGILALANEAPCIAIVGTRFPSLYGRHVTEDIALSLVEEGFIVVSGMAKGVDSTAHKAAIKYRGKTIAVWGTGINRIYPFENRQLAGEIEKYGLILTEYSYDTPPLDVNFPERNRIISGLSIAVIVTEASLNSGTMITVSHALDQGREVFAVPGQIYAMMSQGTNKLIKQGGSMVTTVDELIKEIKGLLPDKKNKMPDLPQPHIDILSVLSSTPADLDTVIIKSGFDTARVMGILTEMELSGVIKQLPGKRFIKTG